MIDINEIKTLSKKIFPEVLAFREDMHMHPELAFNENRTSQKVTEKLDEWGIPYKSGVAKTGIVAYLKGKNPESRTIALRGDMDALPIEEKNDVPYKSKTKGLMHACGHDVHTSSLLGTAWILNELKDEWSGTIKLFFQPSEEKLPGGASVMIKEGVMENPKVEHIFGQHVYPELPAGQIGMRPGSYMASADEVYLEVVGKGGHGALPHYNIDPIIATAQFLITVQQVISRNAPPVVPTVLSFGKINSDGGATNVIPEKVHVEGTFRTFDEEWREKAHERIREVAKGIELATGATFNLEIRRGYPFVYNDEELTEKAMQWAKDFWGAENVHELEMRMTAEDFAYFSQKAPALFYRLGVGNPEKGISYPVHSPHFDIDKKALEQSPGWMAYLALKDLE
ncbi:MAG: M20 family metallopeptidase [Chitinophagales bacterium]